MLNMLNQRNAESDPEEYFVGCATSPFKWTEAECVAQYAKMCKKIAAGASYIVTLPKKSRSFQTCASGSSVVSSGCSRMISIRSTF